eukprot:scaffold240595_cov63-Attheya_sp.AAC.8
MANQVTDDFLVVLDFIEPDFTDDFGVNYDFLGSTPGCVFSNIEVGAKDSVAWKFVDILPLGYVVMYKPKSECRVNVFHHLENCEC